MKTHPVRQKMYPHPPERKTQLLIKRKHLRVLRLLLRKEMPMKLSTGKAQPMKKPVLAWRRRNSVKKMPHLNIQPVRNTFPDRRKPLRRRNLPKRNTFPRKKNRRQSRKKNMNMWTRMNWYWASIRRRRSMRRWRISTALVSKARYTREQNGCFFWNWPVQRESWMHG